jgi:hypothetical protein
MPLTSKSLIYKGKDTILRKPRQAMRIAPVTHVLPGVDSQLVECPPSHRRMTLRPKSRRNPERLSANRRSLFKGFAWQPDSVQHPKSQSHSMF